MLLCTFKLAYCFCSLAGCRCCHWLLLSLNHCAPCSFTAVALRCPCTVSRCNPSALLTTTVVHPCNASQINKEFERLLGYRQADIQRYLEKEVAASGFPFSCIRFLS